MNRAVPRRLAAAGALLLLAATAHAQGRLQERFNAAVKVGMTAPVIKLADTEGKQWDLSVLKGKSWVVVHFGACT